MAVDGSYKLSFFPDVSAFKGLGSKLAENFKGEFDGGTDGIGSKLGGVLGGAGKIAAVGLAAASTAVVGLGAAAISAQADIQQSMGGAESVFGEYSQEMKNWAAAAAGSMGMSTNAALETANKMGSLYQGAGIEAGKAAEMTRNMSQRAADVASVMGVDLSSAMDAVAGAAKGNFTMMDNLGVAMNDTTLKTYAAEKGYEKLWTEMSNGEKSQVAYEMFMERTGQYAGNFAAENTSLAGSMEILNSSWANVMSSLGDPEMLNSAMGQMSTAITGVFSALQDVLPGIVTGLATVLKDGLPIILETVSDLIPELVSLIQTALPELITAVVDSLPGLLQNLISAIVDLAPVLLEAVILVVEGLVQLLPGLIENLAGALVTLLPMILTAAIKLLMAIIQALPTVIIALVAALPTLIEAIVIALIQAIPLIIEAAIMLVGAIIQALVGSLGPLTGAILGMLGGILMALGEEIYNRSPEFLQKGFDFFMNFINGAANILGPLLAAVGNWIMQAIGKIVSFAGQIHSTAWGLFMNFINGAVENLGQLWSMIRPLFGDIPQRIIGVFSNMGEIGKNLVMGLWNGILNVKDWILSKIAGFGSMIMDGFKGIFDIHSPSRLMRDEVGFNIGAGIGEGISQSTNDVLKDAANFSSRISSGFDISADVDYGDGGAYAPRDTTPGVTVVQTVQKPENMMEMYVQAKRGASAGLALV